MSDERIDWIRAKLVAGMGIAEADFNPAALEPQLIEQLFEAKQANGVLFYLEPTLIETLVDGKALEIFWKPSSISACRRRARAGAACGRTRRRRTGTI